MNASAITAVKDSRAMLRIYIKETKKEGKEKKKRV
jgi:hypothetical protein